MRSPEQDKIKKEYLNRWMVIADDIPDDYLTQAIHKCDEGTKPNRIVNCRYGRTYDLDILKVLENMVKQP
jgi:7,8-dihydro-6-hydroxymethylpterin-pyrophosphokinase